MGGWDDLWDLIRWTLDKNVEIDPVRLDGLGLGKRSCFHGAVQWRELRWAFAVSHLTDEVLDDVTDAIFNPTLDVTDGRPYGHLL